jgi:putative tryptophan/tyrosine transport system substrate-binding protein
MRRREFISLLAGAAAYGPAGVQAQQASHPVIGFLHSANAQSFAPQVVAFRGGLNEGGFVEGRNLTIEYRWAEGRFDRLPAMAADLVSRKVNAIAATGGNNSNLAAKTATSTIPIVFVSGSDPIKLGLVDSLSRPGGNVTGVSFFVADLAAKALGLVRQALPDAKVVALLLNPNSPEAARQSADAQEAARKLGVELKTLNASTVAEIDQAFAALPQIGAGALLVGAEPLFGSRIEQIVGQATRNRIPAMYYRKEFTAAGGLMSYGTNIDEAYRQAGIYVARVLKGARPTDLPVVQAAKFDFAINLKTARTLGVEFHPQLLATADEVLE